MKISQKAVAPRTGGWRGSWRFLVVGVGVLAVGVSYAFKPDWPPEPEEKTVTAPSVGDLTLPELPAVSSCVMPLEAVMQSKSGVQPVTTREHRIRSGDTLGALFSRFGVGHDALQAVLSADEDLLALDLLYPGHVLKFDLDSATSQLVGLTLEQGPALRIQYCATDEGHFVAEEHEAPTEWRPRVLSGSIQGSFARSASRVGLSNADIARIQQILEGRIDFRRQIRANDRFEIVLGDEWTDTVATGKTRVEAVRLHTARGPEAAFLHDDGNYYDADGESLTRAFLRHPVAQRFRISSSFNPRRLHPVTRRVSPHNGTDFATPIGTPVVTTGDGVVTRVGNHPFAGRYVEIDHHGQFKTRYLHLSRVQVKRGQNVSRGDRIALSGNTGRSTGPHLHYELHVSGRPVDAMKADLPTATVLAEGEKARFFAQVARLEADMARAGAPVALIPRQQPSRL